MILMSDDLTSRLNGVHLDEEQGDKIVLEIIAGEHVLKCSVIGFTLSNRRMRVTFQASSHIPIILHKFRDDITCILYDGVDSVGLEMKNITIMWDDREGKHHCTICSNLDSERSVA